MIGCHTGDFLILQASSCLGIFSWSSQICSCCQELLLISLFSFPLFPPPLRATGDDTRSLCTTVCKWTYLGHAHMQQLNGKDSRNMETCGWDDDFWEEIGLGDLVDGHHAKIGMLLGVLCILFFQ